MINSRFCVKCLRFCDSVKNLNMLFGLERLSLLVLLFLFLVFGQVLEDVLHPAGLLVDNVLSGGHVGHLPFMDELKLGTNLSGHARDAQFCQRPVVLVAADRLPHDILRRAGLGVRHEWRLFGNLLEDGQDSGPPLLDIVCLPTIERIDEFVAVAV